MARMTVGIYRAEVDGAGRRERDDRNRNEWKEMQFGER